MERAKLFKNGGSQAVRLPQSYRFEGEQVFIKRLGKAVVLLPDKEPWRVLVDSLELFSDDFMEDREQPPSQVREDAFE